MATLPAPPAGAPRALPFRAADGWTLHLWHHPPGAGADRGRAALLLAPGMMLSGRSLDRPPGGGMASWFAARGHPVYCLDVRGHGASGPHAGAGGDWTYDEIVAFDVPAAAAELARRHPGRPRVWVGHSLSAHAAAAALGQRPDLPVDAAVLIAPVVWIRPHEPSWPHWVVKRITLAAWSAVTRAVGHTPARRLGLGSDDEAPGYVDQFRRWAREGAWTSLPQPPGPPRPWSGRVDYLAGLDRIRIPVLVVAARGDRWIARPECVRRFAAAIGDGGAAYLELGRRELELQREPGHMTLVRDPHAAGAWRETAAWIDRSLAACR